MSIIDECAQPKTNERINIDTQFMLGTWFSFASHFMPLSRVSNWWRQSVWCWYTFVLSSSLVVYVSRCLDVSPLVATPWIPQQRWCMCLRFFAPSHGNLLLQNLLWHGNAEEGWCRKMERVTKSFYFYTCLAQKSKKKTQQFFFCFYLFL